jgi:chromosome segregation protein
MFRFLELELHGWDFWPSTRVPLDADVVILSGPNGSGKTTMLDAVRQILNASRLSQNRRLAHYLRRPNQPALVRAVVSNKADHRGRRPFDLQRVFSDEATLACALVPNGGAPEKRFAVLSGRVPAPELQQLFLEGREWLPPERYRRVLDRAGVSRSLMHILALEQGRADELSRKGPRELFRWVMEARGTQQVLERYNAARLRYQDSLKEVERQQAQIVRHNAELARVERLVRRLEEYESRQRRVTDAEDLYLGARLQGKLSQSCEIEEKLPELRTKVINLTSTVDRLGREIREIERRLETLSQSVRSCTAGADEALRERDRIGSNRAVLQSKVHEARGTIAELQIIPAEDSGLLRQELDDSRQRKFELLQRLAGERERRRILRDQIAKLEKGIPVFPPEVQKTLAALEADRIPCSLAATLVEVLQPEWANALESALGPLRFALCVAPEDQERAVFIAQSCEFPGPLVATAASESFEIGPLGVSRGAPQWFDSWLRQLRLSPGEMPDTENGTVLCLNAVRREQYGTWVSKVDTYVLGGNAIRAQLERARRNLQRLEQDLATVEEAERKTEAALKELERRLELQRKRAELQTMAADLPSFEEALRNSEREFADSDARWSVANEARLQAERALDRAEFELKQQKQDMDSRQKELDGTRNSVSDMESRLIVLETETRDLLEQTPEETRRAAESGMITISPERAERDLLETRAALEQFSTEEPVPEATVRDEHKLILRNIQELEQHVFARQREADAARTELNQCRGEYLQVIGSTLHDYRRRAYSLAEIARARVEIELPKLENTDKSIDEATIVVRIGFDGKPPTEIGDTAHSGGQQVIAGLILLMSMAETQGDSFFIVDEPFAHLSLDRVDEVGKFLRGSGSQFLITVPTTLDRGQLDPASLLIVLSKKDPNETFAPRPIVARV